MLNNSPSVYYRLNESSGTTATDDSGNSVTGTYHSSGITYGVTGAIAGDTDTAISSTGVKTLTASDSTLPSGSSARTVEMWVKPDNLSSQSLMLYGTCCNANQGFEIYLPTSTTITVSPFGSNSVTMGTGQSFEDGSWHLLDVTYDGTTTITVYMDGQSLGTGALASALNTVDSSGLQIGSSEATNYFSGSMDEFAVYPSALTSSQIGTHWRVGNNVSCPTAPTTGYAGSVAADSPARYWRLGETSGMAALDYSGNCRTAAYNSGVTHLSAGNGAMLSESNGAVSGPSSQRTLIGAADGFPSGSSGRTVDMWMKPANLSSQDLFFYGLCCSSNQGFEVMLLTSTSIEFSAFGSNSVTFSSLPNFEDSDWHYLAISYDGSVTVKLYLDNAAYTGTLSSTLNTTVPGSGLALGSGEATNYFSGSLDDFAIYPTALSANRVAAHYNASGRTPAPQGTPVTGAQTRGGGINWCVPCHGDQIRHGNMTSFPIDTATGNFWHAFSDVSIPGRSYPLEIDRTYNSSNASTNGPFGYGWQSNYGMSLAVTGSSPNQVATITQENGSQVTYDQPASGTAWTAEAPRFVATLTKNLDGTWTFVRHARDTSTFNSSGQLIQAKDLNGYTTTFTYTSGNLTTVTDPAGRTLALTWTGSNITTVTDPNVTPNRIVTYTYNGSGELTDVTDVAGGVTHFAYDGSHRITTMKDPVCQAIGAGCPGVQNHYDGSGRVDWQKDQLNRQTSFAYTGDNMSSTGGTTTTTDPSSNVTCDTYLYGVRTSVTTGYGTGAAATTRTSYDTATLTPASVTDPNGNATVYTHDSSGNVLTVTDPLGRVTTNTYNGLNEALTTKDGNGVTTTMTYDANGNLLTTSTPVSGSSCTCEVTAYHHANATYPGDVTSVDDPDSKTSSFHYDSNGYRDQVKDPLGNVTGTVRNADGFITSSYSPKASCTWNSSPPTGCSATYKTAYTDNTFGDVLTVTDPLSHVTTIGYDSDQNRTSVQDGNGNTTTNKFDVANELCWTLPGGTSTNSCTSPPTNGRVTDYNSDGTVSDQKDGKGNAILTYGYNARGQVTSVTDALSNVTTYTLDANGNVLTKKDPVTSATCTGTKIGCTTMTYDNANELKTVSYSDGVTPNITSITYDSDGQRTGMSDGTGSPAWVFDNLHRVTSYANGNSTAVSYTYNLRNLPTTITYPGSHNVTRAYDDAGRLTSVQDWLGTPNSTSFGYDANSNLTTDTFQSGAVDTYGFNAADQMTSISDVKTPTTIFSATYTRDSDGQLATDNTVPATNGSYKYTALNQLCYAGSANTTACASPPVGSIPYAFDNADNLTTNNSNTQQFNNADELCWTVTGSSANNCATTPTGATTYGYDNLGNRTSQVPAVGSATCTTYDQANRLTKIQTGTGSTCTTPTTVGTYAYDGSGLRQSKTVSGTTTQFLWSEAGGLPLLLDEKSGTSNPIYYISGPEGLPIEQIDTAGTVHFYHHDQLGSTRAISSSLGVVENTYTYDPYGGVTATGTVANSLQFSAEYKDAESGLTYLRARYYDPRTGQFMTRDPMVATTQSAYGYSQGNPLNLSDPSGLDAIPGECGLTLCPLPVPPTVLGALGGLAARVGVGIVTVGITILSIPSDSGPPSVSVSDSGPSYSADESPYFFTADQMAANATAASDICPNILYAGARAIGSAEAAALAKKRAGLPLTTEEKRLATKAEGKEVTQEKYGRTRNKQKRNSQ